MRVLMPKWLAARERGDTMVEVLIAIAVVSLILGGAYVTTNRSLQATRAAQERSVALKLAESQIERLKGLVSSDPDAVFSNSLTAPSANFCIASATGEVVAASNAACAVNNTGAASTDEPIFHLSMQRADYSFVLTETWTDFSGRNTDSLRLRYRVYD